MGRVPGSALVTSPRNKTDETSQCTVRLPLAACVLLTLQCACARAPRTRPRSSIVMECPVPSGCLETLSLLSTKAVQRCARSRFLAVLQIMIAQTLACLQAGRSDFPVSACCVLVHAPCELSRGTDPHGCSCLCACTCAQRCLSHLLDTRRESDMHQQEVKKWCCMVSLWRVSRTAAVCW